MHNCYTTKKLNGSYGYIDESGNFIIHPQFDWAGKFSDNGLAHVLLNHEWGYIDEFGEFYSTEEPEYVLADIKNIAL